MSDWLANEALNDYAMAHTCAESALLQKLISDTEQKPGAHMLSGRLVGQLLAMLIKTSQAKTVLDVGTFTGYSALSMAEALPEDGRVFSIESSSPTLEIAKSYFAESPAGSKIHCCLGDAITILPSLDELFDLIFIDADKNKISEYYELALAKLRTGGLLIIDDVLWRGEVLEAEPSDKRAKVMQVLNKHILNDPRVENVLLPVRHGLNIVFKR
ncbi:MAG: class I SAM-dependent methyltransferase [Gammaproteobacteria bacterium]|nr:class I SAM-dependent methyltransferase [Gammaproteobacteria bacterium]